MASLTTYRRTLAPLLGEMEVGAADAGASIAVLGCATALQSGARVRSTVLPASYFRGKWLHRPNAAQAGDRDRLIATYDPINGYLYPDEPWTLSPGGEAFEILSLFSGADLNALVNTALKRLFVRRDLTFSPAHQNVRRHQLNAAAPWLQTAAWVYQLGHLQTNESRDGTVSLPATDPYRRTVRGEVEDRAGEVWVVGPSWQATDTVYALCACRAYDLCRPAAGTYGSQSGLSLETDEAPVDAEWLAWAAISGPMADRLAHLEATDQANQRALQARQMAASRFSLLTREHLRVPDRTLWPRPTWIGPALPGRRRGAVRW